MSDEDILYPIFMPDDELEADLERAVANPSGFMPAWVMESMLSDLKAVNDRTRRRNMLTSQHASDDDGPS